MSDRQIEEYRNYVDSSEVFISYYRNHFAAGLERHFLEIEEWLEGESAQNFPLCIEAEKGVGKKTLLVKWMEYHQEARRLARAKQDIILIHFATAGGNNGSYTYAIYKLLIRLREMLNVGQKVELHEEKLRRYFSYWLEVCDRRLQNKLFTSEEEYERVIIVIEGVDSFLDPETGRESNLSFWLPVVFPRRIRLIVTADENSEALRYFRDLGSRILVIPPDSGVAKTIAGFRHQQRSFVNEETRTRFCDLLEEKLESGDRNITSLFAKIYLACFLPSPEKGVVGEGEFDREFFSSRVGLIPQAVLRSLSTVKDLLDFLIEFWEQHLLQPEIYKKLLIVFIITQKGVTIQEIKQIVGVSDRQLAAFLAVFKVFLMRHKDLLMLKNVAFKKAIQRRYGSRFSQYHEKVADVIAQAPNSIRKLEEQTFHLFMAKSHFKLKEVVSQVQNFLLLYNPYNKYDLCKYWQVLEENHFDPVFEYNSALEGFESHFRPSPEDLFRIIVQISRFLKEFSDFQNYTTPRFKHPRIVGNPKIFKDLCLLPQLSGLSLLETLPPPEDCEDQPEAESLEERVKQHLRKMEERKRKTELSKVPLVKEQSKPRAAMRDKSQQIYTLNLEIPSNRQKFIQHFRKEVEKFLQAGMKEWQESREEESDRQATGEEPNFKPPQIDYSRLAQQQFELELRNPQNYYYKRWIWLQFPWVALSLRVDYSLKMKQCFASPTEYLSVAEESELTKQALKIAILAKSRKQQLFRPRSKQSLKPRGTSVRQGVVKSVTKKHTQTAQFFTTKTFLDSGFIKSQLQGLSSDKRSQSVTLILKSEESKPKQDQIFITAKNDHLLEGFLPKIRNSVSDSIDRDLYRESNRLSKIRKEYDNLCAQNLKLARRLKQLKIVELSQADSLKALVNNNTIELEIKSLEQRFQSTRFELGYSQLQRERLHGLLQVCKSNEAVSSEEIKILTQEANNLNKMIRFISQDIAQVRRQITDHRRQTKVQFEVMDQRLSNLTDSIVTLDKLKRLKSNFSMNLRKIDKAISQQMLQARSEDRLAVMSEHDHHFTNASQRMRKAAQALQALQDKTAKIKALLAPIQAKDPSLAVLKYSFEENRQIRGQISLQRQKLRELEQVRKEAEAAVSTYEKAYGNYQLQSQSSLDVEKGDEVKDSSSLDYYIELKEDPGLFDKRQMHKREEELRQLEQRNVRVAAMLNSVAVLAGGRPQKDPLGQVELLSEAVSRVHSGRSAYLQLFE